MKIFTTLMLVFFVSVSMQAQLFIVDSPASVAGSYQFSETAEDAANPAWGVPVIDSIWCGDLKLVDDGMDPNSDGCTPVMNDLTDNIAVIDRGACNFSIKVYHAQEAGAIAAIIVNNQPGNLLVGMLGLDSAQAVVIPVIFITLEDGTPIKNAMETETVSACIGNIVFDNNISISTESTLVPMYGTVPADQIESSPNALSTSITPALRVTNDGLLDANAIQADVAINFTPTGGSPSEVWTGSASATGIPVDTSVLLTTQEYDYAGSATGVYDITYNVAMETTDELDFNNTVTSQFTVSDDAFSKSPWDMDNDRPQQNVGFTIAGGGPIEMISGFNIPNGENHFIDSVQFQVSTSNETLAGITIKVNVYNWEDTEVPDSSYQNAELSLVGINNITFPADYPDDNAWVTLPVLDAVGLTQGYQVPDDGGYYLVGTRYEGPDLVFFGFYNNYDHTITDELALFPTIADFPYLQVTTFPGQIPDLEADGGLFTDFFGTLSQAMYVNGAPVSTKDVLSEIDAQINIYPNPVAELLTSEVTLSESTPQLTYKITDATGRLIYNTQVQNVTTDKAQFNVSQLPVGQYFLTIQTDKGIRTELFSVNR